MVYKQNWRVLTLGLTVWLGGCATHSVVPVPCPKRIPPPPALMAPPESPATREALERLLPPTSPPASETPPA